MSEDKRYLVWVRDHGGRALLKDATREVDPRIRADHLKRAANLALTIDDLRSDEAEA